MATDSPHSPKAQSGVDIVTNELEKVQALICGLSSQLATVTIDWNQFNDTKAAVTKALAHVQPVLTEERYTKLKLVLNEP